MSLNIADAALRIVLADIASGKEEVSAESAVRMAREIDAAATWPPGSTAVPLKRIEVVIVDSGGVDKVLVKDINRVFFVDQLTYLHHKYTLPEQVQETRGAWSVIYAGEIERQNGYIIDATWKKTP